MGHHGAVIAVAIRRASEAGELWEHGPGGGRAAGGKLAIGGGWVGPGGDGPKSLPRRPEKGGGW